MGKVMVKGGDSSDAPKGLADFGAYRMALELFDHVVADMSVLGRRAETDRLVAQQIASADSIASNIEEGYGRGSRRDYAHFLTIARGSAQETAGRYLRMKHWLDRAIVEERYQICLQIIAILTATIKKLRSHE